MMNDDYGDEKPGKGGKEDMKAKMARLRSMQKRGRGKRKKGRKAYR